MAELLEILVADAPSQTLTVTIAGRPVDLAFRYNETTDRWSFDLGFDGVWRLHGRRLVAGADLIGPFQFGIGKMFAADWEGKGSAPDRQSFPTRRWRVYFLV